MREKCRVKNYSDKTGYGEESFSILQKQNNFPTFVAQNIFDVCNFIKKDFSGDN